MALFRYLQYRVSRTSLLTIAVSFNTLMKSIKEWNRAANEVGLTFNVNKTKITVQYRYGTCIGKDMKIGRDMIEVIDEFVCLGTASTNIQMNWNIRGGV